MDEEISIHLCFLSFSSSRSSSSSPLSSPHFTIFTATATTFSDKRRRAASSSSSSSSSFSHQMRRAEFKSAGLLGSFVKIAKTEGPLGFYRCRICNMILKRVNCQKMPNHHATATQAPANVTNHQDTGDLLGLNDDGPNASTIEESNALALAIVSSDTVSSSNSVTAVAKEFDPTGWELALVSTPSSGVSAINERQLAGGLDSLTLNSLYDEAFYRVN
ncbi:hypothetical protein Droror1_Dr00014011 [Drosera rotundifolia]